MQSVLCMVLVWCATWYMLLWNQSLRVNNHWNRTLCQSLICYRSAWSMLRLTLQLALAMAKTAGNSCSNHRHMHTLSESMQEAHHSY